MPLSTFFSRRISPLSVPRTDSAIDIQNSNKKLDPKIEDEGYVRSQMGNHYVPIDMQVAHIRSQIPAHLFVRSTLKSSMYLLHDLVLVLILLYATKWIDTVVQYVSTQTSGFHPTLVMFVCKWTCWALYWVCQGIVCTGIWVIAHECGHLAFSPTKWINHAFGLVLHSVLLVPYHSWRITHSMHHKSTNHMTRDQVFVPTMDPHHQHNDSAYKESPLYSFMTMLGMLLFGWPVYLLFNVSGQKYTDESGNRVWASHFKPTSPMFSARDYFDVVVSNMGVFGMMGLLGLAAHVYGIAIVVQYYLIPYLIVNGFLVTITFLQHTHKDVPHYNSESFTFMRGAVATIDRDYGILNHFFHHIADTHVAHHLFSNMPHYHAVEATRIVRQVLANTPYYRTHFKSKFMGSRLSLSTASFEDIPTDSKSTINKQHLTVDHQGEKWLESNASASEAIVKAEKSCCESMESSSQTFEELQELTVDKLHPL